jgi:phthiocerol/phenolphthiocerol synthesis type-I polyketide synthase E
MSAASEATPETIAVIGLGCRFPGASSAGAFWKNLRAGVESITRFSAEELRAAGVDAETMQDPRYVAAKGVVDADRFDAGFFGVSPREAALMDPQQRIFLETAWSALEDAGYDPRNYDGSIGVFAGSILSIYLVRNLWPNRDVVAAAGNFQIAVGNDPTFLATSTSYQLDLRGPSVSVGTACSTSLVAVHLACQSLLSYESDMVLAGGVSVHLPLTGGYRYEDGGVLSPDGHCRPFDADGRGTVSSDGAGVVVLKRLSDAIADGDAIHAVIRGSAMNNDGRMKVGYTAPSERGEARVIAEALAVSGVAPESMSWVETHGAATLLGDPIEVAALVEAFGDCGGKRAFCALGSVKSNIGHLDAAAGIAGLIKTVLALKHRELPPTLHFQRPNPQIDFTNTPFYVNRELQVLDQDGPVRAGVSSFGIGGTNVHVVLEEPPPAQTAAVTRPFDLIVLSARTATALEAATDRLADHLEEHPELEMADAAFTLRHGRRSFAHRRILACSSREDAVAALRSREAQRVASGVAPSRTPGVVFMFPGLGDHYPAMGWELYCTERVFRDTVDRCAELLAGHLEGDIRDFLYPAKSWSNPVLERVAPKAGAPTLDLRAMLGRPRKDAAAPAPVNDQPAHAQPAIFVTELALAELIRNWGIEPEAFIGHSIGEFTAAYLSGVLSLRDALEIVALRARLIQSQVSPGAMLAVPLAEEELRPLLPAGVSLGAINAARLCIASGEDAAVTALAATLAERGISCQRLRSTHAYHSAMMEGIVEPLTAALQRVELHAPRIPYVSCITGTWITDEQATDPAYWARHLCRTVRFQQGLSTLFDEPHRVLLEVGPGQGLTSHAISERARVSGRENPVIPTMRWSYGLQSEAAVLLRGIGQLWIAGAAYDSTRFLARDGQRRVQLPTYPFERQRYWIDPPASGQSAVAPLKKADVADWFYLPNWKPSVKPRTDEVSGNWLILLDRCGVGADVAAELTARGANVTTADIGDDFTALIRELCASRRAADTIVHLGSLTAADPAPPTASRFAELQELGYSSVVRLIQALCREGQEGNVRLELVANHLHEVHGGETLVPEKATLRAPAMVAPQEHPGLVCRTIDTDIAPDDPQRRDALVAQLLDELTSDPAGSAVAFRRGRRWVLDYEPVRIEAAERSPLRHRGVYLLTGGLGGVGLVLARHLAKTAQARLVLIGRSAFPARSEWDACEDESTRRRIAQLEELEELGAEVLVLTADVSSEADMRRVLAAIDERFGALHGVIHGAGAVGIETFREIRQANAANAESQFNAKVRGTLVLDRVLADRRLDFCLSLSSLSAILGGLGFVAYSAANLFLDAFAQWKNRQGGTQWTSVDWDSWRLGDTRPVIAGLGATVSEFVMQPGEGAAAFERILAQQNLGQVVVSSGDLHARLRQWIERGPAPPQPPAATHERPNLSTPYEPPNGELEQQLAGIWQELFGVASVGVQDNFFELGGHSLLATQLNARLSSKLHVEMSLAALLQAPTIAELAIAIVSKQAENTDPEMLAAMLAELALDEEILAGGADE